MIAVAPILTNCGQNSQSSTSAIGYQAGTISAGCLAITGPIPFSASSIGYDPQESGQILGGRLTRTQQYPGNNQTSGTIVLGGSVITGPLIGSGQMGTVAMTVATVQQNPNYSGYYGNYYGTPPAIASAVGTITLSASAQQAILQQVGSSPYGNGYNNTYGTSYPNTGYSNYGYNNGYNTGYGYNSGYAPQGAPIGGVCVSSIALNLTHRGTTLSGSVEVYVNNTQSSQVLTFY